MYRLMKAEWYRLTHSNHFLGWIAFFCAILILFPITMNDNVFALNMEEFMPLFGESWFVAVQMFIPTLVGAIVASGYVRKTAYYEVMAGDSFFSIITSKVVVDGLFVAVCAFVASCIVPAIICMENGVGGTTNVVLRLLLSGVVIVHECAAAALIVTTFRHMAAAVLVYVRFIMVDTLVIMLYNELCASPNSQFRDWFAAGQISHALHGELDSHLVVVTFASMLIECACWYILSYIGMKKKMYN